MNAFLTGLEQATASGIDLSTIHSVASFFVSRVDTEVDKRLDAIGTDEAKALRGKAGIANARLAYQAYEEVFGDASAGRRWPTPAPACSARCGPRPASRTRPTPTRCTSPSWSRPTPSTRCRSKTLDAVADHGEIAGDTITRPLRRGAARCSTGSSGSGISYDEVTELLEREGVDKFEKSWAELLQTVTDELDRAKAPPRRPTVTSTTPSTATGSPGRCSRSRPTAPRRTPSPRTSPARRRRGRGADQPPGPTLWGDAAESEASIRLVLGRPAATSSRDLPSPRSRRCARSWPPRASTASCSRGMGGSSLAPEVITRTAGVPLVVLDSTDPEQVRSALADGLDAHRARRLEQVRRHGRDRQPAPHLRAGVPRRRHRPGAPASWSSPTPGSPLEKTAARRRLPRRVQRRPARRRPLLRADRVRPGAQRAGRRRHRRACSTRPPRSPTCSAPTTRPTPALVLGAALGGTDPLRDKLVFADDGSGIAGFGDWAEQLIAESTGKEGKGLLPGRRRGPAGARGHRRRGRRPRRAPRRARATHRGRRHRRERRAATASRVAGPLGAQFLLWEYAVASPAGCSASTRSTSPTSRARRRPPAACSTRGPSRRRADLVDGDVEVRGHAGPARRRDAPSRTRSAALLGDRRPARLPRRHGLPRPRARRGARRGPRAARPRAPGGR